MKRLVLALIFLVLMPTVAFGVSHFEWDAVTLNSDGSLCLDLAGYKIYCGNISGVYLIIKDCGMVTPVDGVCSYPINSVISADGTYYCVATAYDIAGNESEDSNEVNFTVNTVAPNDPQNFGVR